MTLWDYIKNASLSEKNLEDDRTEDFSETKNNMEGMYFQYEAID